MAKRKPRRWAENEGSAILPKAGLGGRQLPTWEEWVHAEPQMELWSCHCRNP